MDYFERIGSVLDSAKILGERSLASGTRLIGHVPHVAPEAWFHQLYAPITPDDVTVLERAMNLSIPAVFSHFLTQHANGLRLYSGHLYIRGFRASFSRAGDAVWQPFSIITPNVEERPRNARPSHFFIGGYGPDGSQLYIDAASSTVHRCSMRSAKSLFHWPSFESMLESEVERLSKRFDNEGRLIDSRRPTTP